MTDSAQMPTRGDEQITTTERRVVLCTTKVPEPHERGEFPLTCYACHLWADS